MSLAAPSACDRESARHLLQRATWGPRSGEIDELCRLGPRRWIERQFLMGLRAGPSAPRLPAEMERRLEDHRSHGLDPTRLREAFPPGDVLRARGGELSPTECRLLGPQRLQQEVAVRRLVHAAHAADQLRDRLTAFWSDHFNVSLRKGPNRWLVGDFEATAIRPHVLGSFPAMLRAVAMHPAMLVFLDNVQNVAAAPFPARQPGTVRGGARRTVVAPDDPDSDSRPRAGNENFARELLELHTLGLDGGYTERDVEEVARVFTGWGIAQGDSLSFAFRPRLHDSRPKRVLGIELGAGRGMDEGEEVLALLAEHPSTARHLAGKLVRYFVNEAGDGAMESDLAATFLEGGGDLLAVSRALFEHPRFGSPENRSAVFRTPFEYAVAALRAVGGELTGPGGFSPPILTFLRSSGSLPWHEDSPAGVSRGVHAWSGGAHLLERLAFAESLAGGRVQGVSLPRSVSRRGAVGGPFFRLEEVLELVHPGGVPPTLAESLRDPVRLVTLGLGGPAFQWM